MSYEEREDNDQANGAGNRFDQLDLRFKAGGDPRKIMYREDVTESMDIIVSYGNGEDLPDGTEFPLSEDMATMQVVREMAAVKRAKEAADTIAKELGRQYDYLRLILVPERFEAEGLKNIKLDGIGRIGLRGDLYASIMPGQKEAAFQWLDDNGRGDLVQKNINSSSLKASMKRILEKGDEEIPESIFKVTPYTMATITRT